MSPDAPKPKGWLDPRAGVRVGVAASVGIVVGGVVSIATAWQAATLTGWDAGALLLVTWIWWVVGRLSPDESQTHARREDTSVRLTELIVLAAGVAILAAVALALIRAGNSS